MARSRRLCRSIAPAIAAACFSLCAEASPWPREQGRLFVSAKANYFESTGAAPLPEAPAAARFERFDSDLYLEYGLSRRITLAAKVVYGEAEFFDGFERRRVDGFAEFESGVQYAILHGGADALSVKVSAATPTRFENGGRPGVVSDGIDAEIRALYGRTLMSRPVKAFATVEAAYRRRFGDGADQARADLLLGIEPGRRLLALLEAQSRRSMRNEEPGGADYDVLIAQPSIVWRATRRFALQAGASLEIAGRNLDRGSGYFLALWSEF